MIFALFILLHLTSYSNNLCNYLFGSGKTEKKALELCIKETEIAMKRLVFFTKTIPEQLKWFWKMMSSNK
jgi:hypothetical protein